MIRVFLEKRVVTNSRGENSNPFQGGREKDVSNAEKGNVDASAVKSTTSSKDEVASTPSVVVIVAASGGGFAAILFFCTFLAVWRSRSRGRKEGGTSDAGRAAAALSFLHITSLKPTSGQQP